MSGNFCPVEGCHYELPDVGEVLAAAFLTAHTTTHRDSVPVPVPAASVRAEKVRRPDIASAGTTEDWVYFQSRWGDYVRATRLVGQDRVIQLLECCDEQLRRDLTRNAGGTLVEKSEEDVLAAMKMLAVREENPMVARVSLHNMRQDRGEPIRAFGARLRGQAGVCKFTKACATCGAAVSYSEESVVDVLYRGLADSEIQMDLLGDPDQNKTVEQTLKYIEAKEAGKRSVAHLSLPHAAEAINSSYKKAKKPAPPPTGDGGSSEAPCNYCGNRGHGKNAPTQVRRKECPAFATRCHHCDKEHHFEKVCRSKAAHTHGEQAVFDDDYVCNITTAGDTRVITLDHQIFDQDSKQWSVRPSMPQPFIRLKAEVRKEDYTKVGLSTKPAHKTAFVSAMADTGCQSCLAGTQFIRKLGLSTGDLATVSQKMHAANNEKIRILGAAIIRFTMGPKTTRQIVYITDSTDKLFICREACADLGIIPKDFPATQCNVVNDSEPPSPPLNKRPCGCPKRVPPPPLPTTLPFPATEANRGKLRDHLLEIYGPSTFNTCEHQPLPLMDGPPLRLMIDPNATPSAYHSPIPVPLHWQDEVKDGLDRDVRLGVLETVPVGDPVTWCHHMVICAKKNGSLRRTIDFQPLNRHATRETHHTQSPFHQARSVPHGTKKSVFDAWNGYHSVALHPDDKHYTTFITPWGRYRYRTAPQGYISSGDGYTRRYDELVSSIVNKTKCVDDTLLWSTTIEESYFQACEWLDTCGRRGITLNPDKLQFAADTVEFAGFEISTDTVRPCPKFTRAITDFPTPKNLTDVRSWFGLINQVSYAFSMTATMAPFRDLLKPSTPFHWDDDLQQAFNQSKLTIVREIEQGVRIFDKSKPTCLATDWSKEGIGFWLFQKHCQCPSGDLFCCKQGWKITLVGSRFTHSAESKYHPVEGEALAVADALDKARHFVLGCTNLTVAVDHKPLLKIFSDRSLDDVHNPRLRNLKEKTLRYKFRMIHIPGVKNRAPDAMSRHPTGPVNPDKMILSDDIGSIADIVTMPPLPIPSQLMGGISLREIHSSGIMEEELQATLICSLQHSTSITWDEVQTATAADETMGLLLATVEEGFPDLPSQVPDTLKAYHQHRAHLYSCDGVVVYKQRLVIPPSLRQRCLAALHSAHQGTSAMNAKAEASIYWPGITRDITSIRTTCAQCNRMAPSQASLPPTPPTLSDYPFQSICADYFSHLGINYLVVVDRYSNWPIVTKSRDGAKGLVNTLRTTFATFGIPDELSSDGGPEFTSHTTTKFLADWGVHHRLSSVAFPHSNCRAEIGVKTVKRLIVGNTGKDGALDVDPFHRAILAYRNTPDPSTKLSPAMCVFGRPTRDTIPILPGKYIPHTMWRETMELREAALSKRHVLNHERWSLNTKRLAELRVGDRVQVQNQVGHHPTKWDRTGSIVEVHQYHQYLVRMDGSGRLSSRNRKFLRKFQPVNPTLPRPGITMDVVPLLGFNTRGEQIPTLPPTPPETTDTAVPTEEATPQTPQAPPTLPPPRAPSPQPKAAGTPPRAPSSRLKRPRVRLIEEI